MRGGGGGVGLAGVSLAIAAPFNMLVSMAGAMMPN